MQLLLFTLRVMCVGWIGVGTWHALPRRQTHLEGMGEDDPRSDCVDKERPRLEGMCFNYNRHENIVVAIPSPIATIARCISLMPASTPIEPCPHCASVRAVPCHSPPL